MKHMTIEEFVESGLLQEANRQFFHPLGVALEVTIEKDGTHRLSGIWDKRADPEGMIFAEGVLDPEKVRRVVQMQETRAPARRKLLGSVIQPLLG